MGIYTPQGPRAFGYLGVIEAAARVKASTQQVWQAVRNEAARTGQTEPGISFGDVTAIRSWAVRMRNADAAYAAASGTDNVTAAMMTEAIWSPQTYNGIRTTPNYSVRAQVTIEKIDGSQVQQWMTWNFAENPLNYTVADYNNKIKGVFAARVATAPKKTKTPQGTLKKLSDVNIQVF